MTRQEEILTLRKYPRHYLWNKPRNQWTPEDVENLKNGVIKNNTSEKTPNSTPVLLIKDNKIKEFQSVKDLQEELKVPYSSLVSILNERAPQRKEFQIFKSKINQ